MKKTAIIVTTVLLTSIAATTLAFGASKHGAAKGEYTHMKHFFMEKMLELSEEQKQSIREVMKTARQEARAKRNSDTRERIHQLDPSAPDYQENVSRIAREKAAQVEAKIIARANVHAQIYEILSPEQQQKFISLKQEMGKHKERHMSSFGKTFH